MGNKRIHSWSPEQKIGISFSIIPDILSRNLSGDRFSILKNENPDRLCSFFMAKDASDTGCMIRKYQLGMPSGDNRTDKLSGRNPWSAQIDIVSKKGSPGIGIRLSGDKTRRRG
jgi:hypothetical protein